MRGLLLIIPVLTLLLLTIYFLSPVTDKENNAVKSEQRIYSAEIFKTPSCGCCGKYASFLEEEQFEVKRNDMTSLDSIKHKYSIPQEMQSCHTTIIGKYFIEGHVPIEAVNKLLKEQPDIDGIALPGMPIGTPGMPGFKEAPFVIYQLKDGTYSEFMTM